MENKPVFTEKQYLGREWVPVTIRLVLVTFCFAAYVFTDPKDRNGDLLAIVGFLIIVGSIIMGFVLHFSTSVQNSSLVLDGLWTARKVKIDLNTIVKAEAGTYSRYILNNPVYNLHKSGTIRFYTAGNDAVYLTSSEGLVYIIGSQHAGELLRAIKQEMETGR